jgi:cytochrome P450
MPYERRFDILSPEFHANPFATIDRMRTDGPVVGLKLPIVGRTWLAVTHESCAALLKNNDDFARDPANARSRTQERVLKVLPRTLGVLASNMLGHDDPEHRRLRGLVDEAFQRRTIAALKPMIVRVADRLLDRLDGQPEADLCRNLPLSVICAMLGLPERDHDRFKNWLGGLKDTANIFAVIRAIPGVISAVRYLRRVSRPGGGALPDGLIAVLGQAEIDGQTLSEDEIVSMIFLLFGAGQETTTHLISGGLFALLTNQDQLDQLRRDPGLMPTCV